MEISPSGVAPVCQIGDQLELTCNTSNTLHRWQFTAIPESGSAVNYTRLVSSVGSSGVALVCQEGDQLELTCNTSNTLHTWQSTAIPESLSAQVTYTRSVSSVGSSGVDSQPITINCTIMITFSRLSTQNELPLIIGGCRPGHTRAEPG